MYASQDLSLVRHFWRCCRAGTCTAQRSPGCGTGCVCDKHTVNKAGKRARSGATTDPVSPSTHTFLLNSAVRHTSSKGKSCRFANCEERLAERKTTARIENETLGWAGLQRSVSWDFAGLLVQIISTQSMCTVLGCGNFSHVPNMFDLACSFMFSLIYSHKRMCLKAFWCRVQAPRVYGCSLSFEVLRGRCATVGSPSLGGCSRSSPHIWGPLRVSDRR